MKTNRKNLIHSQMKQLEEMSRKELVQEANFLTKRIKEIEKADKAEKLRIVELEKQAELLEKVQESISNGKGETGKAIPYLQELLKMKDEKIAQLQKEIDALEKENSSQRESCSQS